MDVNAGGTDRMEGRKEGVECCCRYSMGTGDGMEGKGREREGKGREGKGMRRALFERGDFQHAADDVGVCSFVFGGCSCSTFV